MESERIEKLLQKYWKGETTLKEEAEIKQFFRGQDVPPHLERLKPVFRYYHQQFTQEPLGEAFEAKLKNRITGRPTNKGGINWGLFTRVAASLLLIGLSVYFYFIPRESSQKAVVITVEDPELAYRQTKATLLLISEKLNAGQKYTAEFKRLEQANALFKDYTDESLNP